MILIVTAQLSEHSKHDEDNSLSSSEAAFSGKSHTIRKDDIKLWEAYIALTMAVQGTHLLSQQVSVIIPQFKDIPECWIFTSTRVASHSSQKESKQVGKTSHQQKLLRQGLPHHLNFKPAKIDLFLEGFPRHTSS